MRLAIFSDIHGNPLAFSAVLADIAALGGVDGYIGAGDYAGIGYDPATVMRQLAALPNLQLVRGNTDRLVLERFNVERWKAKRQRTLDDVGSLANAVGGFSWTHGYLLGAGLIDGLRNLPTELRLTLPDGTRMLVVHASPGTDDGAGLHPNSPPELLDAFASADADLVIVGHEHVQVDIIHKGVRLINLGSVSNPYPPDLRASYVILEADTSGYRLEHRRVAYDHAAVIAATEPSGNPMTPYIIRFQRGENKPDW